LYAGGEPFLYPKELGAMVRFCKEELHFESVSIISNGSRIKESWFVEYGQYLDVLGVSCDSFIQETNTRIGRTEKRGTSNQPANVALVAQLCAAYNIKFKINTVVCAHNKEEDMSAQIKALNPCRWKVFQVLAIDGENTGLNAKRDVAPLKITSEEFQAFLKRHDSIPSNILKPEDNDTMQTSYVLLDERMRFLDSSTGGKVPTSSVLDVGVQTAWQELLGAAKQGFNVHAFTRREGIYDWQRNGAAASNACGKAGGEGRDMEDLFK
jgi:radical S-adenosyl methionine domain-containing protein 2